MKIGKIMMLSVNCILFSCTGSLKEDPAKWSNEKLDQWFDQGSWMQAWGMKPDESINRREFAIQYHKNSEIWDKAFAFLKSTNLDTLGPGTHEIIGKDLYAAVSEYASKNDEDVRFEVHKKYADIQYVIQGREQMNMMKADSSLAAGSYDPEKDIAFLQLVGGEYRTATPDRFFIFFPEDAHRPGIKIDTSSNVKKLVMKVKIN